MSADLLTAFAFFTVFAGLIPLAVCWLERPRPLNTWLIATAMAVSCIADLAVVFGAPPWVVSAAYPVSQYGLLFMALAPRNAVVPLMAMLTGLASVSAVAGSWAGPDALPRIAGSLAVIAITRSPGLLVYFGAGTACWAWYTAVPGLSPWLLYQSCRLLGLTLLTVAVWRER